MNSFDIRFHRALEERLAAAIETDVGHVARGLAKDHADYRHRCGQIRGLEMARTIAEEVRKALLDDTQET